MHWEKVEPKRIQRIHPWSCFMVVILNLIFANIAKPSPAYHDVKSVQNLSGRSLSEYRFLSGRGMERILLLFPLLLKQLKVSWWNLGMQGRYLGSVHFSVPFFKSEQCSDLSGWVGLGKVTVQIWSRKKWYAFILKKNEEKKCFALFQMTFAYCFKRTW